jgi:hypothetical protein
MFRFGMADNNICERCNGIETTRHLLWECGEARNMWEIFNNWLVISNNASGIINNYQDIFCMNDNAHVCKVKIKMIQEMIQIQRPSGWNLENIKLISNEINKIEVYNKVRH